MEQKKEKVAVIGAGTMGAGIAQVAASTGHFVVMYDQEPDAFDRAIEAMTSSLNRRIERGRSSEDERDQIIAGIQPAETLKDLAKVDLVIEAIVEDLEVKQTLFEQLETICSEHTVFASNTSSLSITELAASLKDPSRMVGLHFFNPAPAMKLVEVVSGRATASEVVRKVTQLASSWGKHCVQAKSTPGFIVNRVARPFYGEALRLLQEQVCTAPTVDAIMRESGGFKMGPVQLMDLVGHDVNYAVTSSMYRAYFEDPRFKPSLVQKELVDAGLLGRKTGRGFYDYSDQAVQETPHSLDPQQPPSKVRICGELGVASVLADMIGNAGIELEHTDGKGQLQIEDVAVALTDGRSATERSAVERCDELVLFDLALDYTECERVGVTRADQSNPQALHRVAGLFQALGKTVSVIDDAPGMVVMRTVCMLANEGADAVNQGVCDIEAVDTAMRYGTGYPIGPLAWADRINIDHVVTVLQHLHRSYGEDRYRVSPLLMRKFHAGKSFYPSKKKNSRQDAKNAEF